MQGHPTPMSDRVALVFGLILIGAIALDVLANDSTALVFLLRKFVVLVDYMMFWR